MGLRERGPSGLLLKPLNTVFEWIENPYWPPVAGKDTPSRSMQVASGEATWGGSGQIHAWRDYSLRLSTNSLK
jgi:hypothetical protein